MIKSLYVDINHNLYRLIPNVYGAQTFARTTKNDILLIVIFSGFNWTYNNGNQINKTSICIAKLNSTESSVWFMRTKILSLLDHNLNMLQ